MIKYGLISETDGLTLQKVLDLILSENPESCLTHENIMTSTPICITEVGLFDCGTAGGIFSYLSTKCAIRYTGIDNEVLKPIKAPEYINYIKGNSSDVYNQIEDNSQHLIFIDGCHTFPAVIADFFCYAPKVKPGGYIAFHDSGRHINPLHGWQGVGDKNDPDFCLGGVRKALDTIGLFNRWGGCSLSGEMIDHTGCRGFELIFDEADTNDEAGGITVFKRLY